MNPARLMLVAILVLPLACLAPSNRQDGIGNTQDNRGLGIDSKIDAPVDVKAPVSVDPKISGTGDVRESTLNDNSESAAETSGGNIDQSRRQSEQAPEAGRSSENWLTGMINISSPIAIAAGGGAIGMFAAFMVVFLVSTRTNRKMNFANAKLRIEEEGARQAANDYYIDWMATISIAQMILASRPETPISEIAAAVDAMKPKHTPAAPATQQQPRRRISFSWLKIWNLFRRKP